MGSMGPWVGRAGWVGGQTVWRLGGRSGRQSGRQSGGRSGGRAGGRAVGLHVTHVLYWYI